MFWLPDKGTVLPNSSATLNHNGVAFRIYGNAGTGGRLDFFTLDYGGRESWCANGFETGGISQRLWALTADSQTITTNNVAGVQSMSLPRRNVLVFTWNGLEVEQVELVHKKFPFVISLLRARNTSGASKQVDAKITLTGITPNTHKAGGYWWDNKHFMRLEGESTFGSSVNDYYSQTTFTIPNGETHTFQAVYGGTALTIGATGQPLWSDTTLLSWAQSLDNGAGEEYALAECNRIDNWYDRILANTNIGSQPLMDYLPLSLLYTEEQIITQASGNQYTLHGGWADPALVGGGSEPWEYWYSYPTSTLHQSYPYHFVLLQAELDDVVKNELKNYASHQNNTDGSMAFHMWPDDVAYPYASTYTEIMFIMSVYQYIAYSQDHNFLNEVVNGKTILERVILAYQRVNTTKANGLATGADWHDGWDGTGSAYNSQGSMAYAMALDCLVELDPTNASIYSDEATQVRGSITSVMLTTDAGHTFYKRRIGSDVGTTYFNTWAKAILDSSFWGVLAGVGTIENQTLMMNDLWNGGYVYGGSEGVGVYNGNNNDVAYATGWLCQNAWSEKFFEYAIADSKLGNTRCIDKFADPSTVKRRFPEQVAGPGGDLEMIDGYDNSGEPTYSAVALFYKWIVEGIFGVKVSLDGTVTTSPTVPQTWETSSIGLRVGSQTLSINQDGTTTLIHQSGFPIIGIADPEPITFPIIGVAETQTGKKKNKFSGKFARFGGEFNAS